MANILFRLRETKGTKPQPIYLIYRFGRNDKLVFSTGLKIEPQYWNNKTGKARDKAENIVKTTINNHLNHVYTETNIYIAQLLTSNRVVTKEALRLFLNDLLNKKNRTGNKLTDFINDFMATANTRTNPMTGVRVSPATLKTYRIFCKEFFDFEQYKGRKYDFTDIDLDFYGEFTEYLTKKQFAPNTQGKYIKTLKVILNNATDKGINNNTAYKTKRFKVIKQEADNIYLTERELKQIHDIDLMDNPTLDKARDLFLIGAWTGLRYSDFTRLNKDNIIRNNIIITQQKTSSQIKIPLHKTVIEILDKYNYSLPTISNQRLNTDIKTVCQKAKILGEEQKTKTKGSIKISKKVEKWALVSSHTARRSFATNLFLSGFPTLSIMKITGHKTEKAFMQYIKVTNDQHANLLRKHWLNKGEYITQAN